MSSKARFITESLAIFPDFNCGLEINCGNALRISAGRKKIINLWGLNPVKDPMWLQLGLDPFIKIGNVYDIPYPDNFFDWVVYHEDLNNLGVNNRDKALQEVTRVGSDKFLFKASMKEQSAGDWMNYLRKFDLYPEVMLNCIGDMLDMEFRKNFL